MASSSPLSSTSTISSGREDTKLSALLQNESKSRTPSSLPKPALPTSSVNTPNEEESSFNGKKRRYREQESTRSQHRKPQRQTTNAADPARQREVAWMIDTWQRLDLDANAPFLSANYFDQVTQGVDWSKSSVQLRELSCACLGLAIKFDCGVIPDLAELFGRSVHPEEQKRVYAIELHVLRLLEWKLNCATPIQAIRLLAQVFDLKTDSFGYRFVMKILKEIVVDQAIVCPESPGTLGVACMIAGLRAFGLVNTDQLSELVASWSSLDFDTEYIWSLVEDITSMYCTNSAMESRKRQRLISEEDVAASQEEEEEEEDLVVIIEYL